MGLSETQKVEALNELFVHIISSKEFQLLQDKMQALNLGVEDKKKGITTRGSYSEQVSDNAEKLAECAEGTKEEIALARLCVISRGLGHISMGRSVEEILDELIKAAGHDEGFDYRRYSVLVFRDIFEEYCEKKLKIIGLEQLSERGEQETRERIDYLKTCQSIIEDAIRNQGKYYSKGTFNDGERAQFDKLCEYLDTEENRDALKDVLEEYSERNKIEERLSVERSKLWTEKSASATSYGVRDEVQFNQILFQGRTHLLQNNWRETNSAVRNLFKDKLEEGKRIYAKGRKHPKKRLKKLTADAAVNYAIQEVWRTTNQQLLLYERIKKSEKEYKERHINELKRNGFRPNQRMLNAMARIDMAYGEYITLNRISDMYKENERLITIELQLYVNAIGDELKVQQQESVLGRE